MKKVSARLLVLVFALLLILALSVGIGTVSAGGPIWTRESDWDAPDDVGKGAAPAFADIDADSDYDLFISEQYGVSFSYENTGSVSSPVWTAKPGWNLPDVGMGDVIKLLWNQTYAGQYPVDPWAADVTGDGEVGMGDVIKLLWNQTYAGQYPLTCK